MIGGWIWKKRGSNKLDPRTGMRLAPYPYRYEAIDEGSGRVKATGEAHTEKDAVDALLRRGVDPQHINYGPRGGTAKRNPATRDAGWTKVDATNWTHRGPWGHILRAKDGYYAILSSGKYAVTAAKTLGEAKRAWAEQTTGRVKANPGRSFPARRRRTGTDRG